MNTRSVAAGNGWQWIRGGFELFRQNPVIWIALFFIYLLICMGMSIVPIIGPILVNLLAPVFMAGFMLGCQALESGEELEINHLFAGFKHNTAQLITVGGLYLAGMIVIAGVIFVTAGGAVLALGEAEHAMQAGADADKLLLPLLLLLALMLPLIMAYWFAPTLVVFHGISAADAMKLSFAACLRNIMPFTVYSLVCVLLLLLAAIPLGLGLVVMIPTMTASLYVSYKDIFSEE
jgi:hypothetical protein